MNKHCMIFGVLCGITFSAGISVADESNVQVNGLTCEYLVNPIGLDIAKPRFAWRLETSERGQKQTAYQILVASSKNKLDVDNGDIWDSGIVKSDSSIQVEYAGSALRSCTEYFWKVRVMDKHGKMSLWSKTASWRIGFLDQSEWKGEWIGGKKNWNVSGNTSGYHATPGTNENDEKWVQIELESSIPVDKVVLHPACPEDVKPKTPGFGFPVRFKVEASNDPDFKNPVSVADYTKADYPNPGARSVILNGNGTTAKYIRVTGTKLWRSKGSLSSFCFALSELQVFTGDKLLSEGCKVTAKDSVDSWGWAKGALTDGIIADGGTTNGYHSMGTNNNSDVKWIQVSLNRRTALDNIILTPSFPNTTPRISGFGFPVRFRIDVSDDPDFRNFTTIADFTKADYPNPGRKNVVIEAKGVRATHVRMTATRLWDRNSGPHVCCFSLAEMDLISNGKSVSSGAKTKASDSIEGWGWSSAFLTDGQIPRSENIERLYRETPWLRKSFELSEIPLKAYAHVASIGYHELYVNGKKVSENVLTPGVSDLGKRISSLTYDISSFLRKGKNTLGLWLAPGWARTPRYGFQTMKPLVLAQFEIIRKEGPLRIMTDSSWKVSPSDTALLGPWTFANYGGEIIDGNKDNPQWNRNELDDSAWESADTYQIPARIITEEKIEGNIKASPMKPLSVTEKKPGLYVIDMGKVYTGWLEMKLKGRPGDEAVISISERPNQEMTYGAQSKYVFGSSGEGVFRNRFNYMCGRWITVSGVGEAPKAEDITGYVIRNNYETAALFKSSNEMFCKIFDTTRWTLESLSLGGYFVDCHSRERWGYGAEAHVMMYGMVNNYKTGAILGKFNRDWMDVQSPDGNVAYSAPTYAGGGGPGWSGICVALPWETYLRYGDKRILEISYPTMRKWISFLDTKTKNDILCKWGGEWDFLGDWVAPGRNQGALRESEVSTQFFNNCYYVMNLQMIADIAAVLDRKKEAEAYREKAVKVAEAVHQKFYDPKNQSYAAGTQTYLAYPLYVGITPPELQRNIMKRLENEILVRKKGHIDTGVLGTYFMLRMFVQNGRSDLASVILSKDTFPSWGNMLKNGATSIWEQWDGEHAILHSSFVSIGGWFIEGFAGIQPDQSFPGYKHFIIRPGVSANLTDANCEFDSPYGKIISDWNLTDRKFKLKAVVPPNTTAALYIPTGNRNLITESGKPIASVPGIVFVRELENCAVFSVESGTYKIESPYELSVSEEKSYRADGSSKRQD